MPAKMSAKIATKAPAKTKTATRATPVKELLRVFNNHLPNIIGNLSKRINVDQLRAEGGSLGDLRIDKVTLGDASIGNIAVTNTNARLQSAQAFLRNVRTVLQLGFRLDWKVDLGWIGNWGGSENLGSLGFGMNVGNVSVPSLGNINMTIPAMAVPNAAATIQPIDNINLGAAKFKNLVANDTGLPAAGFTLAGMGLGGMAVSNITVPATHTEQASIEEFALNNAVSIPAVEITNLRIPAARIANITTGGFAVPAQASSRCLEVDLGILEIKLCVTPTVHMNVESMHIQDAQLSATIGKMKLENMRVPVSARGITMDDLALEGVRVNNVTI